MTSNVPPKARVLVLQRVQQCGQVVTMRAATRLRVSTFAAASSANRVLVPGPTGPVAGAFLLGAQHGVLHASRLQHTREGLCRLSRARVVAGAQPTHHSSSGCGRSATVGTFNPDAHSRRLSAAIPHGVGNALHARHGQDTRSTRKIPPAYWLAFP